MKRSVASKKSPKSLKPGFKVFRLIVVMHEGVKMFFDPITKRAMAELRPSQLPYQSTIELWRNNECLAKATHVIVGSRDPMDAFEGTAPLVKRDAWLEDYARRSYHHTTSTIGSVISIGRSGIRIGDELVLSLSRECLPNLQERRGINQWFEHATLPTQDAVVELQRDQQAWNKIARLIPDVEARLRFWDRHNEKPWREALRLAERYAVRKRTPPRSS